MATDLLTPERAARIELELRQALADVNGRFADKKSSELNSAERQAFIEAQAKAEQLVLERHGVDAKTWARASQTRTRAQQQAVLAAMREVADSGHQQAAAPDVIVERGHSVAEADGGTTTVIIERAQSESTVDQPVAPQAPRTRKSRR